MPFDSSVHFHGIEYVVPAKPFEISYTYNLVDNLAHHGQTACPGLRKRRFFLEEALPTVGLLLNGAHFGNIYPG